MSEVRPRVTGTEIEYSVGLRRYGQADFEQASQDDVDEIVKHVKGQGNLSKSFLVNGARCYQDDDCLEYATGEDDSLMGTVANEIAGEELVDEAVAQYVAESDAFDDYILPKRCFHGHGVTTGYHINLCAEAENVMLTSKSLHRLGLLAATSYMYTGSGGLYKPNSDSPAQFVLSQKGLSVRSAFSVSSNNKPLVLQRHMRSYCDSGKFHRVQYVGMDQNASPWAMWMSLATPSLCLRTIEQKVKGREMNLRSVGIGDNPFLRLTYSVASNLELNTTAELDDGTTISAVDIQRELFEQASRTEHTDEEDRALGEWEKILDDIDGDRSYLQSKAGWAIRKQKIEKYALRNCLSLEDEKVNSLDYRWDTRKVRELLRSQIWSADMPEESLIKSRKDTPCPTTRASIRGRKVAESKDYLESDIGWDYYRLGPRTEQTVYLKDPLMTEPSPE